jgi:23S rRNA pseudouridine2605 synthase
LGRGKFVLYVAVRLQKYLAEAGVASRRASEQLIIAGRVTVNDVVAGELGVKVEPGRDRVTVDGAPVKVKRKKYIALHKPRGFICTRQDEEGRDKIGDLLPGDWTDLFSVGRLDYNSEGLIFLTNDGDFCLKLTHPRYGIPKTYLAKVQGRVTPEMLKAFTKGVFSDGEKLKAKRAKVVEAGDSNSTVELEMTEGKNREVRRLFESQRLTVRRLQRTQIGPIKLGELKVGKWRILTDVEVKSILEFL